jgi:hypothetical protein
VPYTIEKVTYREGDSKNMTMKDYMEIYYDLIVLEMLKSLIVVYPNEKEVLNDTLIPTIIVKIQRTAKTMFVEIFFRSKRIV